MKSSTNTPVSFCSRFVRALWLVTVVLNSLTILAVDSPHSPDLVFCPLQKEWVKKSKPKVEVRTSSFLEICSSTSSKKNFLHELLRRADVLGESSFDSADLFLNFTAKSDRAFSELPSRSRSPRQSVAVWEQPVQGGVGRAFEIEANNVVDITFDQLSRPPTSASTSNFPSDPDFYSASFAASNYLRGPPQLLS